MARFNQREPNSGRLSRGCHGSCHSVGQVGQPKSPAEVNDHLLAGVGEDWEPLILLLAPTLSVMSMDELPVLLLNQEA